MAANAVSFSGLGFAYRRDHWVFRNYSAEVPEGSVFALLGPNGRGKTTLLKLILGILKPKAGTIVTRGQIAFVPQLFHVTFDYSVSEMVLMGRSRKIGLFAQPTHKDRLAAIEALDRVGLADLAHQSFKELSGGQRQLAIFARALASEAKILMLDEPTSALDLRNQDLVLDRIGQLSRQDGLTVLMTTHHPHHALAVADNALLMLGETDFAVGPSAKILSEGVLSSLYGVTMKRFLIDHDGKSHETLVPIFGASF